MNPPVTVVILAAGLGTRMKSSRAKVLHEAGGDTLLNHVIRAAMHLAPPDRIIAVIGHQAAEVRESVKFPGISFAVQDEQKGTGHAVLCARDAAATDDGLVLILNGDGPLLRSETLSSLVELLTENANLTGVLLTTELDDPTGYGRILRDEHGLIAGIVEQKAASPEQLKIREINPGAYCFRAAALWKNLTAIGPHNPAREYYLTDIVEILRRTDHKIAPLLVPDATELLGINTRVELAAADKILRARKTRELMLAGVTIENPDSVTVDVAVEVRPDSVIECNVQLRGATRIGTGCHIGTGSVLRDCEIENDVSVLPYVIANRSHFGSGSAVGPFSRFRFDVELGPGTRIGNFVELKNTRVGRGSKAQHLAYLGDANIGADVNIGAGTITCNYDGVKKHATDIADQVFVGSNSTLVAPLQIATGAYIGAGSVITKPVEADALALGRAQQIEKPGWAKRRREMAKQKT
jgi:bifunctional UDP-N-acetylglucosamine pyrophosphorylase/glucosamine-1-phosphate N-acetyltransferase